MISVRVKTGFTLLELLIVIVIIAIGTTAIIPQIGQRIPGCQTIENSKNILVAMRLARQFARTSGEITIFVLDTNEMSFAVKTKSSLSDSRAKKSNFLVRRQLLGKNTKIVQLAGFTPIGGEQGLIFWPDGSTNTADIILTTEKKSNFGKWHLHVDSDGSTSLSEVFQNG